jgi:hypothetical protein
VVGTWPFDGGGFDDFVDAGQGGDSTSAGGIVASGGITGTGGTTGGSARLGGTSGGGSSATTASTRTCVGDPTRDVACPGPEACLNEIDPAYVLIQDHLDGSSSGKLVGTPHPEFSPGVVGAGLHPMRNSEGAAVRYAMTPKFAGTLSFWVKVIAPLDFMRGSSIGLVGHESGMCDDFFMQIQADGGLNVAIYSASGGTSFRDVFPAVLGWDSCETHHIVFTWSDDESPELFIDGLWTRLSGAALPYLPGCDPAPLSLLFGASRELYQSSYSPGSLVFDELLLLSRSLTNMEKALVAVDDACPCSGPAIDKTWDSPQAYVNCVSQKAKGLVALGRIDSTQAEGITTRAAQSSCGPL